MHRKESVAPPRAVPGARVLAGIVLALVAGVLLALNADVLRWPFISDDFIFMLLTRTRGARELFGAFDVVQNYFRPVGRELYFFVLSRLAGTNAGAFHAVNFCILLATHVLLLRLVWQLAGARAAVLAVAVYALQYLHRVQMAWVSCSQDLLATLCGVAAVLAHRRARPLAAGAWCFVGLLAKESIAPLVLVIAAWEAWSLRPGTSPRLRARQALRRSAPLWIGTAAWALLVLAVRAWKGAWAPGQGAEVADVTVHAGSVWEGLRSGLLSFVYLDQPWRYLSESFARSAVPWLAMGLVALLAWSAFRWAGDADLSGAPLPAGASRRAVGLGVLWAVLGALPPALAGHHFSAYYMSFAAVGFALACGPLLAEARWPVAAGVLLLAPVLNVAANGVDHFRLTTHTDELPGVGYVTIARLGREARFLDSLQVALQRERPPRGAAIYLSHAPKGVSFATAGERAPKVWFDDPTLELTYITRYESGAAGRAARFFRFDEQTQGFVPLPAALVDGIVATEALLAQGRWAEARDHVERTLAYARPGLHELERVELLNDLGMIEWRLGDKPSARVRWTEAAAEAPEHVAVRLNLTVLEADAGRLDSALVHVRDVLSIEPDQPLALLFLARIERQLGHVSDAAATWQRLESENPAFADSVERHDGSY